MKRKLFPLIFLFFIPLFFSCQKIKDPVSAPADTTKYTGILSDLVTKIKNHQYGGNVHSLVIAKDDSIIFEQYFNGYSRNSKNALYSVTKSFSSALIGICIDKGLITNTDIKALDFFPEYKNGVLADDSAKGNITLEHLLKMTAGFKWDEWTTPYSSPSNPIMNLAQSPDWVQHVFNLPLIYAPGTHGTYNSGVSHLLSAIVTKASGKSTQEFARVNLFSPIGITDYTWETDNKGINIGGWGLSLRSVDMLKLGLLYLHNGRWNNQQIISEEWIQKSSTGYYSINQYCKYGYQWWRYGPNTGTLYQNNIYFASGRGEQFIWVIPAFNAVAVCTAWNDGSSQFEKVLREYILGELNKLK